MRETHVSSCAFAHLVDTDASCAPLRQTVSHYSTHRTNGNALSAWRVVPTPAKGREPSSVDNLGITPLLIHNFRPGSALPLMPDLRFRPLHAPDVATTQRPYPQLGSFLWITLGALLACGFHVPTFGRNVAAVARTQAHSNPGYPHTHRLFARSTAFMKFVQRVPPG